MSNFSKCVHFFTKSLLALFTCCCCCLRCRSLSSFSDSAIALASAASSSSGAVIVGFVWDGDGVVFGLVDEDVEVDDDAIDACNANAKASSSDLKKE